MGARTVVGPQGRTWRPRRRWVQRRITLVGIHADEVVHVAFHSATLPEQLQRFPRPVHALARLVWSILAVGAALVVARDHGRLRVGHWRDTPLLSVLSVCALLASLLAWAVLASGRGDSGPERNALHEWAEGRHSGEPPASITLPEVTCRNEPDDLEALRDCFRAAERRGESATGHLTAEASYPDALDWWATVHPDGTGGYIHRVVTVETAPDVVSGTIGPRGLRTILTAWTTETCPSVVITAEPGYPGFRCAVEPVSGEWTESRRPTTDAERADLSVDSHAPTNRSAGTTAAEGQGGLLALWAFANTDEVAVDWLFDTTRGPLVVVIAISAMIGFRLGAVATWRQGR